MRTILNESDRRKVIMMVLNYLRILLWLFNVISFLLLFVKMRLKCRDAARITKKKINEIVIIDSMIIWSEYGSLSFLSLL